MVPYSVVCLFMPARKCLGTKKATFQSIIVILEVSISTKNYRQKIQNGGDPHSVSMVSQNYFFVTQKTTVFTIFLS